MAFKNILLLGNICFSYLPALSSEATRPKRCIAIVKVQNWIELAWSRFVVIWKKNMDFSGLVPAIHLKGIIRVEVTS
jgi:hypothetical protein